MNYFKVTFILFLFRFSQSKLKTEDIPTSKIGPQVRQDSSMAYFSLNNELYLFGGYNQIYFNDLWKLSLDTLQWSIIYPRSSSPAARSKSGAFLRESTLDFCIFGGSSAETIYNDLWCYKINSFYWKKILTHNSPPGLYKFTTSFFNFNNKDMLAVTGSDIIHLEFNLYILDMRNYIWDDVKLGYVYYNDSSQDSEPRKTWPIIQNYEDSLFIVVTALVGDRAIFHYNISSGILNKSAYFSDWFGLFDSFVTASYVQNGTFYVLLESGYAALLNLFDNPYYWQTPESYIDPKFSVAAVATSGVIYTYGGWIIRDRLFYITNSVLAYWMMPDGPEETLLIESYLCPSLRNYNNFEHIRGQFYLFGGVCNNDIIGDLWTYNPLTEVWSLVVTLSDAPSPRYAFGSDVEGDAMIIWGGVDSDGFSNQLHIYNSYTNTWNYVEYIDSNVPSKRKSPCIIFRMPNLYIIGGTAQDGDCTDIWLFDFGSYKFHKLVSIPPLTSAKCYLQADSIYAKGTSYNSTNLLSLFLEYNLTSKSLKLNYSDSVIEDIFLNLNDISLSIGGRSPLNNRASRQVTLSIAGSVILSTDLDSFTYGASYLFYNTDIYYFGGGYYLTEFELYPYLANPRFARISLLDLCSSDQCKSMCSEGFYYVNNSCKICPKGTYSEGRGNLNCTPCPKGYYNSFSGATSKRQCYMCPENTFNGQLGAKDCKICPAGFYCPSGSKEPSIVPANSSHEISIQPNLYSENMPTSKIRFFEQCGIIFVILLILCLTFSQKFRNLTIKLDIYNANHTRAEGETIKLQRTLTGGVFTLLFYTASVVFISTVVSIYINDNIVENKGIVPLVVLEEKLKSFTCNLEVLISLSNYGDSCIDPSDNSTLNKCNPLIQATLISIKLEKLDIFCEKTKEGACKVLFECKGCEIDVESGIEVTFCETLSFASGISVNVTSDSSIPESRSSVFSDIRSQSGYIYIGPDFNEFYFGMTPSYFTSSSSKFPMSKVGYHVSSDSVPKTGSQGLIENVSMLSQINLRVIMKKYTVGLYTSRDIKQDTVLLISSIFGTFTGLCGIFGFFMGRFENVIDKMQKKPIRAFQLRKILGKRKELEQNNKQNSEIDTNSEEIYVATCGNFRLYT